jgi:hypothetical protein
MISTIRKAVIKALKKKLILMIIINARMILHCNAFLFSDNKIMNENLSKILNSGFLKKNDCYFLKAMYKNAKVKRQDFIDNTGYECFVNSFNIDDYITGNYIEESVFFAKQLLSIWNQLHTSLFLKCIISETDFGAKIRFHVIRIGENWIVESDVDNFDQAICILTSSSF